MSLPVTPGGEFARDYNFYFSLYTNPLATVQNITSLFKGGGITAASFLQKLVQTAALIADQATQVYVSSLAKKVSPPAQVLNCDALDIGGIKITVPKQYELSNFTVEYLDDNLRTVRNFHNGWLNSVRNGWNFELLSLVSLSCVFGDAYREPVSGLDVPVTVNNYPQIFPIKVTYSELDRYGTDLQVVTVEYLRVPRIKESSVISTIAGIKNKIESYVRI